MSSLIDPLSTVSSLNYNYATNNAPPPSAQQVRLSSGTLASVTAIYIDNTTSDSLNASAQMLALVSGDTVRVTSVASSARYGLYKLSAAPIDHSTWVELPVTVVQAGQTIQSGACVVALTSVGALPPFLIYHFDASGARRQQVGFSNDLSSAAMFASGWLVAAQQLYPKQGHGIGVVQSSNDALVGQISWIPDLPS